MANYISSEGSNLTYDYNEMRKVTRTKSVVGVSLTVLFILLFSYLFETSFIITTYFTISVIIASMLLFITYAIGTPSKPSEKWTIHCIIENRKYSFKMLYIDYLYTLLPANILILVNYYMYMVSDVDYSSITSYLNSSDIVMFLMFYVILVIRSFISTTKWNLIIDSLEIFHKEQTNLQETDIHLDKDERC